MSKRQLVAMLEGLPASCVFDAIEGIEPRILTGAARAVLYNLEAEGVVSWSRESPQAIALTEKGRGLLESFKAQVLGGAE